MTDRRRRIKFPILVAISNDVSECSTVRLSRCPTVRLPTDLSTRLICLLYDAQYLCQSQQCLCYTFLYRDGPPRCHRVIFSHIHSSTDWLSRRRLRQSVSFPPSYTYLQSPHRFFLPAPFFAALSSPWPSRIALAARSAQRVRPSQGQGLHFTLDTCHSCCIIYLLSFLIFDPFRP